MVPTISFSSSRPEVFTLKSSMYARWVIGTLRYSLRNTPDFRYMAIDSGDRHRQKSRGESAFPWNNPLLKRIARMVISHSSLLCRMSVAHLGMALATAFLTHRGTLTVFSTCSIRLCGTRSYAFWNYIQPTTMSLSLHLASLPSMSSIAKASRHPLVPFFRANCSLGMTPICLLQYAAIPAKVPVRALYIVVRQVMGRNW